MVTPQRALPVKSRCTKHNSSKTTLRSKTRKHASPMDQCRQWYFFARDGGWRSALPPLETLRQTQHNLEIHTAKDIVPSTIFLQQEPEEATNSRTVRKPSRTSPTISFPSSIVTQRKPLQLPGTVKPCSLQRSGGSSGKIAGTFSLYF